MARGKTIAMKGSSRAARHPLQPVRENAGAGPNQLWSANRETWLRPFYTNKRPSTAVALRGR